MANALYDTGKTWILENTVDTPGGSGLKILLMQSDYVFSAAHATVTAITGAGTEVARTGSVPSLATVADQLDGGTATVSGVNNGTITQAVLFYDAGTGDANAIPIAFYDGLSLVTNGSDINVDDNVTQGFFELA